VANAFASPDKNNCIKKISPKKNSAVMSSIPFHGKTRGFS